MSTNKDYVAMINDESTQRVAKAIKAIQDKVDLDPINIAYVLGIIVSDINPPNNQPAT